MAFEITWLGHAALALRIGELRLLVDPFLTGNPAAAVKPEAVEADFILVSHGHDDHIGDALTISDRTGAEIVAASDLVRWLEKKGAKRTHAMQIGGSFQFPFGRLTLTMALHGSSLPDGSCGGMPAGFLIRTAAGERIYIAGDTGLFGDMALIGEGGLDLAVLPIGGNFTMDPQGALRAVRLLRPRIAIPYHFNTWEIIAQDPVVWKKNVEAETPTQVVILEKSQPFAWPDGLGGQGAERGLSPL